MRIHSLSAVIFTSADTDRLAALRFQRVLRRVEGCPDWAQLAIELGYFDRAHMIREFRTLFGCTPGEAVALIESTH